MERELRRERRREKKGARESKAGEEEWEGPCCSVASLSAVRG